MVMVPYDIESHLKGKKLIGYGADLAFLSTQQAYPLALDYIVDDTPTRQGQQIQGIDIRPYQALAEEQKDQIFVIVYIYKPETILKVFYKLNQLGLRYGTHYTDCSLLHYRTMGRRLEQELSIQPSFDTFFTCRMLTQYAVTNNLSYSGGTWLFLEIFEHLFSKVPGDVAECGVFRGGNAFLALVLSDTLKQKKYHLFDSFKGFPDISEHDPATRKSDFDNNDFNTIQDLFANFPQVEIHKGFFKDTFSQAAGTQFSLVYLDCDLYESMLECCEFFYRRLSAGGGLLFHDWIGPDLPEPPGTREMFRGVDKAIKEFFGEKYEDFIFFPETSHALLIKK